MNHIGDTNKMVSETPISDSTTHNVGDLGMQIRRLERQLNAANERIKRLEEAHSWRWRPIETAPHNHTWVLGYDEKDGETGMIIFNCGDESEPHWTNGMREWSPTHWMPLPDEPKTKEAKL